MNRLNLITGLVALLLLTGMATAAPKDEKAGKGRVVLELLIAVPAPGPKEDMTLSGTLEDLRGLRTFNVDSFFDIDYISVSNIGSSGQDGVRATVDSFFDITYQIFGDPDFDLLKVSIRGSLADAANPGAVLEEVDALLGDRRYRHRGHVTVLK